MSREASFMKFVRAALFAGSIFAIGGSVVAQDKATTMPDAQVEANVLKALAAEPQLADQQISTTTVYGTVTLSGSVKDEPTRVLAETAASKAPGVQKVIDELTLSSGSAGAAESPQSTDSANAGTNPSLQSDGTMARGPDQQPMNQQPMNQDQGNYGAPAPPSPAQPNTPLAPGQSSSYPPYGSRYPGQPYGPPPSQNAAEPPYGAQQAGLSIVVPAGAMLRVRINQGLDSKYAQPGAAFDAVVVNDVVADGEVAIPRGASVQGTVVDVQESGALKGRGELSLQLTQVTLGGKSYAIVSDKWSHFGADKTAQTVNSAVGLGAVGALIGAVTGGGAGAAIGAGLGGAAGLGASAASGRGQAMIPPEAILTFHLTQQAALTTVSQAEMDRLGSGVPIGSQRLQRRPPPPPYYGPVYYPRPYYPYPY